MTESRYDPVAGFYVAEIGDGVDDPGTAALLATAEIRQGSRLLDLACGQGRVSREAARRGASVVGVDVSQQLIASARLAELERPLGIEYVRADAAGGTGLEPGSFDVVLCNFGLSDIDDLAGALATAGGALRAGGRFVFSILHPCFPGWGERASGSWPPGQGYFREGWWRTGNAASAIRRRVGANHRTVATYLNALTDSGLRVDRVVEPPPPVAWTQAEPDRDPVPTFLVVRSLREPSR